MLSKAFWPFCECPEVALPLCATGQINARGTFKHRNGAILNERTRVNLSILFRVSEYNCILSLGSLLIKWELLNYVHRWWKNNGFGKWFLQGTIADSYRFDAFKFRIVMTRLGHFARFFSAAFFSSSIALAVAKDICSRSCDSTWLYPISRWIPSLTLSTAEESLEIHRSGSRGDEVREKSAGIDGKKGQDEKNTGENLPPLVHLERLQKVSL